MDRPGPLQITVFLAMFSALVRADQLLNPRKLDEGPPELNNRCGNCPCDNPCSPSPPPPSPPPPSPPPPSNKPPPSNYCPPPPPSGYPKPPNVPPYVYVNGPPGSVYPVYPYYSGERRSSTVGMVQFLISGVLWLLSF